MTQREAAIADRWRARVRRTIAPWGSRKQSRLQWPSTVATHVFLRVSYNKNKRTRNKHMQSSGRPTATQTDNIHTYKQAMGRPPHTKTNTYKQAVGRPLHTNTISTDTKASWGGMQASGGPTATNKNKTNRYKQAWGTSFCLQRPSTHGTTISHASQRTCRRNLTTTFGSPLVRSKISWQ